MKRDYTLLIGACGWLHAGWGASFYPDDLPTDWRTGYYANAYPLALITAQERAMQSDPQHWREDCDDSLRFVAEWSWRDDLQQAREEKLALAERHLAVLLQVDPAMEVQQLAEVLQRWQVCGECIVDFSHGQVPPDALQVFLKEHDTGWCWRGWGAAEGMDYGALAIARVGPQKRDAKAIRSIVETCLAADKNYDKPRLLLFDGQPPDVEDMNTAEVIAALL